ncbi:conserved Plasmodium protein, unknown function [Plasmodium chabaudi adami]|uniref:Uncharacterized protein n=1 Tax=Plasmodium chabaudi adami TaxID=5826 RepID=A0A1D3LL68_PLACE|nr:conserved Plasmodium protein, unknown function [Plasmodium chabaudi adami]
MEAEWDETVLNKFYNYLYECFDYEKCLELENSIRLEMGTEPQIHKGCGSCHKEKCNINISSYKFKKDDNDLLGEIIDNEKSEENIKKSLNNIAEKAYTIYNNILTKEALKNGNRNKENQIDIETDHFLRTYILKTVFNKYIIAKVKKKIKEIHCKNTKDIISLANPLNMKEHDLNRIQSETIANLMNSNVSIQLNFMGKYMKLIYEELIFIEYNNQFNEFNSEYKNIRTDFYCWAYITSLDREKQQGLYKLLKELSLIPYELNKKANLSLQICTLFRFLYYSPNKSFLKKHAEGGYGDMDNGQKVTCLYIPYVHPDDDVTIKVYKTENGFVSKEEENNKVDNINQSLNVKDNLIQIVKPQSDSLILLQTRNTSYEISKTKHKFFIVNLSIYGPVSLDRNM